MLSTYAELTTGPTELSINCHICYYHTILTNAGKTFSVLFATQLPTGGFIATSQTLARHILAQGFGDVAQMEIVLHQRMPW